MLRIELGIHQVIFSILLISGFNQMTRNIEPLKNPENLQTVNIYKYNQLFKMLAFCLIYCNPLQLN